MAMRECAACEGYLDGDEFSNNQWSKGQGFSRCLDCVDANCWSRPVPPPPARWGCRACSKQLELHHFSGNQISKRGLGEARCKACVGDGCWTQFDVTSAARTNDAHEANFNWAAPFAHGTYRDVYRGTYSRGRRTGQACVAKVFQHPAFEQLCFASDMAATDKCIEIVQRWNTEAPCGGDRLIKVNRAEELQLTLHGKRIVMEPYIDNFFKFNSNSGFVSDDGTDWSDVMQALSHFSYHATGGQFLLCDIQGGVHATGAHITDPVVMSTDRRFGPTDLGARGIASFFARHRCTGRCRREWATPRPTAMMSIGLIVMREGTTMGTY